MARDEAYRLAIEKIEKARLRSSKKLDLRGIGSEKSRKLTELPQSFSQLTQLQSLDVSGNQLTEIPKTLGQLTQLQSLDVSDNQLTELPKTLGLLTRLQSLDLSSNKLTELPKTLGQLARLRSLDLSGNELTALPHWLGKLMQLETLNLSDNQLTTLPQWLGQLTHLQRLNLSSNRLTELPQWLDQLTQLEVLNLRSNQLTALPRWLGQLTQLQVLNVEYNQLTIVPQSLGNLTQLLSLDLSGNQLMELPNGLDQLTKLESLDIGGNQLAALPHYLARFTHLRTFRFEGNRLTSVPEWIERLANLEVIWIGEGREGNPVKRLPDVFGSMPNLRVLRASACQLTELPISVSHAGQLGTLELEDNPLHPELAAAYKEGIDAVKRYLQELAKGAKRRYEAKLLILGDGNEGKTCVSRAVRNLPFQPQVTTRGVDVEQWKFEHPDDKGDADKQITLNIWDFEGQEINHQTHQFFLSAQALYLLVFKCRDQFLMDRAEYWLDTIRARAPEAKVAIVITQSEERMPYVPQDKLQTQYGDLLAKGKWLFAVGCKDNSGIDDLQMSLKRWAADLEFMGREWPTSYGKAEEAINARAKTGATYISRSQLYDIFRGCQIDESIFKDLAGAMSILGVMTEFPDCPDLHDFIVLQPQWLTKAISEIMEDRQLASDKGEIALQRMEVIWDEKGYVGLFPTFHNCMKEFELCYDLEDASRSCLVPLRFGYEKPEVRWSLSDNVKERRVEYKLKIRPPMGLMSRFIVKTHHMMLTTSEHPKGVYWHNGVFLRTGIDSLASEAFCEFDSDQRTLRIQVRAAFPQNFLEQIHAYVKAVFSFFSGLEAERSYGCIKIDEQTEKERKCNGVHSESRIYSAIRKQRVLDCEYEFHDVDPQKLIWGFSSFGEYVLARVASIDELRSELDKKPQWAETLSHDIGKLLGWVEENREKVDQLLLGQENLLPEIRQEAELKLHEYLEFTSQMLDDRDRTSAPGLISISTKDRSKWNPTSYFRKTYILTPFCECEGNIHSCEDGQVDFTKDEEWWAKTAPWIARGTKLLSVGLQLAFAGMPLALGRDVFDAIKDDMNLMKELSKHLELEREAEENRAEADDVVQGPSGKDMRRDDRESRLMRTALARLLEELAPLNYHARQWGSLRRVRMSDNSYRWLCEAHVP